MQRNEVINVEEMAKKYYLLGRDYYRQKNFVLAIQHYDVSIRFKSDSAEAYNARGLAYGQLNRMNLAIKDFNDAISLEPNWWVAYNNRAHAYKELNRPDDAIKDYNVANRLEPDLDSIYVNRGFVYHYKLKQHALAFNDYTQALNLNPDNESAIKALPYLLKKHTSTEIFDFIKAMPEVKQIHLLKQCLDETTMLGEFFKPGNDFCSYHSDKHLLFIMESYLCALTAKMAAFTFLLKDTFNSDKNLPTDISFLITSLFLQLSGLEFSKIHESQPRISRFGMFTQPDTGNTQKSVLGLDSVIDIRKDRKLV